MASTDLPVIDPPLEGEWLCASPPGHGPHAFDLAGRDRRTGRLMSTSRLAFLAGRARVADVHGWDRSVFSPVTGRVVRVHDGEADRDHLLPALDVPAAFVVRPIRSGRDVAAMAGNHVVVESTVGHVLLAHFRKGSLRVRAGSKVQAGQPLGNVGNSGNSVAPHLHIQVMEGPDPLRSQIVAFGVRAFRSWDGRAWRDRTDETLPRRRTPVRFPDVRG